MSNSDYLKNLIANDKLEEFYDLFLKIEHGAQVNEQLLLFKSRLTRLNTQKNRDTITTIEYNIELNKLSETALNIVNLAFATESQEKEETSIPINIDAYSSWGFKKKQLLIDALLNSQSLGNSEMRNTFVSELPHEIRSRINRSSSPFLDVKNIVETVLLFKEGGVAFYNLFQNLEGDSVAISVVESIIKK